LGGTSRLPMIQEFLESIHKSPSVVSKATPADSDEATNFSSAVSSFETRVGTDGTLCRASGPGEEKSAFQSLGGCIVLSCWELKRKFRIISPGRVCTGANS
jgi:hypothetical protein